MNSILLLILLSLTFRDGILVPAVTATVVEPEQEEGSETSTNRAHDDDVQADPDTKCSDVYRKQPTKEVCLSTKDHFFRPCCFCVDKKGNDYCYNIDEARWAHFFGVRCEYRPDTADGISNQVEI